MLRTTIAFMALAAAILLVPFRASASGQPPLSDYGTGTVYGSVKDQVGRPVVGITIWRNDGYDNYVAIATTASDGSYTARVPEGPCEIVAWADSYSWSPVYAQVIVSPWPPVRADFVLGLANLYGTVSTPSGTPIAGARVSILNDTVYTTTNQFGRYTFMNLTPGKYTIKVTGDDIIPVTVDAGFVGEMGLEMPVITRGYASLEGVVRDRAGRPITDVSIAGVKTDSAGQYAARKLYPSTVRLSPTKSGYAPVSCRITLDDYEQRRYDLVMVEQLTVTPVATLNLGASPASMARQGDLLYLPCYTSGLLIVDVNNPENPKLVGNCDTPGEASGVAVSGGFAYVADGPGGLQVVDVSKPEEPKIVGALAKQWTTTGNVSIAGHYVYLGALAEGAHVVDVADPTAPTLVGELLGSGRIYSYGVAVDGGLAYVCGDNGLYVFDAARRTHLRTVQGEAVACRVANGLCWVAGDYALTVRETCSFQNRVIAQRELRGIGTPDHYPISVDVQGNLMVMADPLGGGAVVADTSFRNGIGLAAICPASQAMDARISGEYIYVADCVSMLRVFRIENPQLISVDPRQSSPSPSRQFVISGYGFKEGAEVHLARAGQADIPVRVVSATATTLTCAAGTSNAAPGLWTICVTNADGLHGYLADRFAVTLDGSSPVVGSSSTSLSQPIMSAASKRWRFKLWGKAYLDEPDVLRITDSPGSDIRVLAPGYSGISDGDYVSVSGTFDPVAMPLTLIAAPEDVLKAR